MPSHIAKRCVRGGLLKRSGTLAFGLALFLFGSSSAVYSAQPSKATTPSATKPESIDPLHRETPRSTLEAFLRHEEREDFATAARYFQASPNQQVNPLEIARELRGLHGRFKSDIGLLSNEPDGTVEAGLAPGEQRAGVLQVGGTTVDVILVQVDDPEFG